MSLHDLGELDPRALPRSADEWLDQLPGSVALTVAGRDPTRWRAVIGLLHGNEPSGFRAIHAWLRSGEKPATNVLFIIGAVESARHPPRYTHRMIPGRRDLNRAFGLVDASDDDARQAASILERVLAANPEAVVDLHNNTGHNPPYAVALSASELQVGIASLFAWRYVLARFKLGSLIQVLEGEVPAVTIECGRAGDPEADATATKGLAKFLSLDRLPPPGPQRSLQLLGEPVRVMVTPGSNVAFGDHRETGAMLTFDEDVDRHNFQVLPAGTQVGWVSGSRRPVVVVDEAGVDRFGEYFEVKNGALVTRRSFIPIMMTTNPVIAKEDCLFYAVQPLES